MFVFFCCELSLIALLLRSEEKNDREERWKKRQQNTWPWSNFHIWIFHCAMPLRQCVFIAFLLTVQENVPLQFVWICGTSIAFGHPIRRFFFLFSSIAWCQVLCSHCASQPIVNLQLHSDWISRLFHFWRRRMRRVEDRAHCISMRTRIRCVKKKKKNCESSDIIQDSRIFESFDTCHSIWNYCLLLGRDMFACEWIDN